MDSFCITGKLKRVSLKDIQDAISEALRKLVEETDPAQELHVSVKSLEFDGNFSMRAKMSLTLESVHDTELLKAKPAHVSAKEGPQSVS